MKLKNPFSQKTRWLFHSVRFKCFKCGSNGTNRGGMELHHIFGRVSKSPYNAAPLDHTCHEHILHNDQEQQDLLKKTKKYLDSVGYKPTEDDLEFLQKHEKIEYRTLAQNKGIHVYCGQLADMLNDAGLDMRTVLKPSVDIPWTASNVKEFLWRPIQRASVGKTSTRDLRKEEVTKIYDILSKHLNKTWGVNLSFPSQETKAYEEESQHHRGEKLPDSN